MKILSLDTSSKKFSLAVSDGDNILARKSLKSGKALSQSILPSIKSILKKADIPLKKIDGFAIGLGPGSFTSLRVGLATVKGLAFAHKKPVVGLSSLDLIAFGAKTHHKKICVICDAKRDLVYGRYYQKLNGNIRGQGKMLLTDIDQLLSKVSGSTSFTGDGLSLYQDKIRKLCQKEKVEAVFEVEKDWYPQASSLAKLSIDCFKKKKLKDVNRIVPMYLYPEDCQVRRKSE